VVRRAGEPLMDFFLIDAGGFYTFGGGFSIHNWDPTPAEFERWLVRKLKQSYLIEINVDEARTP
jgi:hypothetical protein